MSSYAEFMGMYSPKNFPGGSTKDALKLEDKILPPMKIRQKVKHQAVQAVIDGYQLIPVYSYLPNSPYDNVN